MHRLSLLPFPQALEGDQLRLNVLLLPRNDNFHPLQPLEPGAPAFADAVPVFRANILSGFSPYPVLGAAPTATVELPIVVPDNRTALYQAVDDQFDIVPGATPPAQINPNWRVKKYLTLDYRGAFNFFGPATDDAVIDDSYHCAFRDKKGPNPAFVETSKQISWGKALAYCLRQPLLARRLGLIYETSLTVDPSWWENGGYLYVNLAPTSDYQNEFMAIPDFLKSYVVRIPSLTIGQNRPVFAPVLFPLTAAPTPPPSFTSIFIEASQYDDGFAKIIHTNQPVSAEPLREEPDPDQPPVYDQGIRLGWDDEQLVIWHNRQMREDPDNPGSGLPIDSPAGVFAYRVDVRREGEAAWTSLTRVQSKGQLAVGDQVIGPFDGELGVEVHPSQLDGYQDTSPFWLPMYFAAWNGQSMVLPDERAADIYQLEEDEIALANQGEKLKLGRMYNPVGLENIDLAYGEEYEFRVRLSDITGGGPTDQDEPVYEAPAPIGRCHFRRNVAPQPVRIHDFPAIDEPYQPVGDIIRLDRPLLGYPAVIYTQKYADPVALLQQASLDMIGQDAFGLPDPDVLRVEIAVEIGTLKMDSADSLNERDSFIHYYTTQRDFPADFATTLEIPIDWRDARVLDFSDPFNPGKDIMGESLQDVHDAANLPLPRARTIRLTFRALCDNDFDYFGGPEFMRGRTIQVELSAPAADETDLYIDLPVTTQLQGIYLQPEPEESYDGHLKPLLFGRRRGIAVTDNLQRIADQLGLERKGLSLLGGPGERIRFGCARALRHTLAPEHGSVTFANRKELIHHWIVAIRLELDRDWTWDALQDLSFIIERRSKYAGQNNNQAVTREVGDISLKRTANRYELQNPTRERTTLIFFDAVDPKSDQLAFPDILELEYTVTPRFRNNAVTASEPWTAELRLPVTINPAQTPKIVSMGLALSPYQRDERYSETEVRQRYVWIELAEPVADPNDALFARVLAYSADPLLSNRARAELLLAPTESDLPLPPELMRVVTPNFPEDEAGIDAMIRLEKAQSSDRHYLLPLPDGLNPDSAELFGFFTYEFRMGHAAIWSTAQGRFGRPLRLTGIQHAPPMLYCNVNRDEKKLVVNAPYAQSVWQGRNVTARPPRTELWALLYAQVHQADGLDFRNILLEDRRLRLINRQRVLATTGANIKVQLNTDRPLVGLASWTNDEILILLRRLGLPEDSPLSVVCVETMPRLARQLDPGNQVDNPYPSGNDEQTDGKRPLSNDLGHSRFLRVSPLTPAPFVCCC